MIRSIAIIIFLGLLAFSCQKEKDKEGDKPFFGYQYHPLKLGQELIYQNDSIIYDDFSGQVDTISFQTKLITESEETDLENRKVYVFGLYRRDSIQQNWKKIKQLRKFRGNRYLELMDENVVYLPLIFPMDPLVSWDVNAKNTSLEQRYVYKNLHRSAKLNSIAYDSTILVSQRNEENLIERFVEQEIYAARVGLVYQKKLALQTEFNGNIRSGYDFTSVLISHN